MWNIFVFLLIFYTYDVVYNWSISLLAPIVLNNLYGLTMKSTIVLNNLYGLTMKSTIVYDWSISLLAPIVLNNLYGLTMKNDPKQRYQSFSFGLILKEDL